MKQTKLKVLKHTGKMPISLSLEICRLCRLCCLFYPSTLKLKRERTCSRLLMLSRGTDVMTEFYFPMTLLSFWDGCCILKWLGAGKIRRQYCPRMLYFTLIEAGRVPCAILISLPVLPFSFERFKVQVISKAYKSDIEILLGWFFVMGRNTWGSIWFILTCMNSLDEQFCEAKCCSSH